jgi:Fungal protein kinase
MDSSTAYELEGSIIHERSLATRELGYTMDVIFHSFATHVQSRSILPLESGPQSLTIPWKKIPDDIRSCMIVSPESPEYPDRWELYDAVTKRWQWPFDLPSDTPESLPDPSQASTPATPSIDLPFDLPTSPSDQPSEAPPSPSDLPSAPPSPSEFTSEAPPSPSDHPSEAPPSPSDHPSDALPTPFDLSSDVPSSPPPDPPQARPGTSPTSERRLSAFFNAVTRAVKMLAPDIGTGRRRWMSNWSNKPIPGSSGAYQRKPDFVLLDESVKTVDEVTWQSPKVIGEYTKEIYQPAKRLGRSMDSKVYLTFLEQPWRRFILGISICAGEELRIHFYDRSGGVVSPPFNIHAHPEHLIYVLCAISFGSRDCIGFDLTMDIKPMPSQSRYFFSQPTPKQPGLRPQAETVASLPPSPPPPDPLSTLPVLQTEKRQPIGRMAVGREWYDLVDILFSSPGFLGRGTVCYLARRGDVSYVIKDYWVRVSSSRDSLNEVNMMKRLHHLDGVPKLQGYWFVHTEPEGDPALSKLDIDCTKRYREDKWRKNMKFQRAHVRLVMTPRARPITMFKSKRELVSSIRDILIGTIDL